MRARALLKSFLGIAVYSRIPQELVPVHRICERWAVSVGSGLSDPEAWDDSNSSKPTELDRDTAILVDQTILKSPPKSKKLIKLVYKTHLPMSAIAEEFRMSEHAAEKSWHLALHFLDYRLRESGNRTVLSILKMAALDESQNFHYQSVRELEKCAQLNVA